MRRRLNNGRKHGSTENLGRTAEFAHNQKYESGGPDRGSVAELARLPRHHTEPTIRRTGIPRLALAAALFGIALSPGRTPAAMDAGRPACDYCRMLLEDPGFGAEITLGSGTKKIYDTVECMASAVLTDSVAVRDVRALTLVDHARPGSRVPIDRAVFLHCPEITSPMGQSLLAFRSRAEADSTCASPRGTLLDWRGVLTQINSTWFQGKLAVEPHVKFPRLKTSRPQH